MRHPKLLTRRVKQLAVLTLAVTSLINWAGIQAPALAPKGARLHGFSGTKQPMIDRMSQPNDRSGGPQSGGVSDGLPNGKPHQPGAPVIILGGATVLTFEGLLNQEPVNEFYNGGTGGNGSGPGPNVGVSFTSNSLALIDSDAGGTGNFGGEPSPSTGLFFLTGTAIMNVPAGFTTGFSFFYSAINTPGSISVFSGPNGTGALLTTLALPLTPNNGAPDPTGQFSPLVPIGVAFAGTAMSVDFGGTVNQIVFDDITIGSATPGECTCPDNITTSNDTDQCGAVVSYPDPTGACGTITCDPPSGSFFPVGTTTVVCTGTADPTIETTVYSSGNIAVPIPASGTSGDMTPQMISVADPGTITDINFRFRANHTFDGDLSITLTGPNNATVSLVENRGGGGDNFGTGGTDCSGTKTVLDDEAAASIASGAAPFAGSFRPETPLSIFDGLAAAGTWTLRIADQVGGDLGTLFCWELEITRSVPAVVPTCMFTVTVIDTQPPQITCPANQTAVSDQTACTAASCVAVTFPAPTATDNCPGVTVACVPPSGSCLPLGITTVTCTATDASGNTATCSFSVTVFDVALQDDSDPSIILLWNSITGQYRFCCKGTTYTGIGKSSVKGCVYTLQHNPFDRRVLGLVDKSVHRGNASLQTPPGVIRCTITDRNTLNDTNLTSCQ